MNVAEKRMQTKVIQAITICKKYKTFLNLHNYLKNKKTINRKFNVLYTKKCTKDLCHRKYSISSYANKL